MGFPMMQAMPGVFPVAGGTEQAAAQPQYMGMPGFAMPMMYPGNVPAQGSLNQQPNTGGAFRNKNNEAS